MSASIAAPIAARIQSLAYAADGIHLIELAPLHGAAWPDASPGAHIDLEIPGIGIRQYSIVGPNTATSLVIAVQREDAGRGGSRWLHEQARPGSEIVAGPLRNAFALEAGAGPVVLVAGGIGITPILPMAEHLAAQGRPFTLHYCVRSAAAAFLPRIQALGTAAQVHIGTGATRFSLATLAQGQSSDTHYYCCGPTGMLDDFEAALAGVPANQVHTERFAPPALADDGSEGFKLVLARSGIALQVPPDRSILDVLLDHGINPSYSCCTGVCGACETRVLAGTVDHRDMVLSPDEHASGATMMICCSRAASDSLTLDL